jgi:hypothetical protein
MKAMKIKFRLQKEIRLYNEVAVILDVEYASFDNYININNNPEDGSERVN